MSLQVLQTLSFAALDKPLHGWGLHSVLCIGWKSIQYFTTRVSQHLDGLLFVTVSECLSYWDHNEHNTSM